MNAKEKLKHKAAQGTVWNWKSSSPWTLKWRRICFAEKAFLFFSQVKDFAWKKKRRWCTQSPLPFLLYEVAAWVKSEGPGAVLNSSSSLPWLNVMPSSCTAPDLDRQEEKAKITSSSKKNYFCDVSAGMDLETKLHKHEKIHWNSSMGAEP